MENVDRSVHGEVCLSGFHRLLPFAIGLEGCDSITTHTCGGYCLSAALLLPQRRWGSVSRSHAFLFRLVIIAAEGGVSSQRPNPEGCVSSQRTEGVRLLPTPTHGGVRIP